MKTDPRLLFLAILPLGLGCETPSKVDQTPAPTAANTVVEPRSADSKTVADSKIVEPSPAQARPTDAQPVAKRDSGPRAEPARLKHDVDWLADDQREGRRAGTAKALESADYIATRFKALGLEAAGTQGFLQEFEVPLDPRTGGRSSLLAEGNQVDEGEDFVPLYCSERGQIRAPIQFVGYGIDDADRGRDDYVGLDLKGKIAIVMRGVPKTPPPITPKPDPNAPPSPHGAATVATGADWGGNGLIFNKVMNCKRRGAIGVIVLQNPAEPDEKLLRFGQGGSARAGIPCAMLSSKGARTAFGIGQTTIWSAAVTLPGAEPSASQGEATLNCDVHREKGPARNVLAKLRGADLGRFVIVGAHYDHLGKGGEGSLHPGEHGQIHNGADDNASGVAAVLEMARLMSTGPRPACDVIFALWSGEDLGLLGSEYWAEHPTVPLANVSACLNLDMVGRANSGKLQILAAGTAEPFASWMADAGATAGLDLQVSTSGNVMGGSSDHATFIKRKIPALHLFSGLHADYHKPSDDADKFEADGAAKVTDLSVDLVRRMCAAGKLAFVEPKVDPNEKQVRSGFRAYSGSIPNYAWEKKGILIDGASPGSPAESAGFLKGDILLQIGDVKLDGMGDFMFALQTYKPGDVVLVRFQRDGVEQETRVTLSTRGQQ